MFAPRHQQTADEMARVPPRRRHYHGDLDTRGRLRRALQGGSLLHASTTRLRLSSSSLGP
jgi:hypothetical protein